MPVHLLVEAHRAGWAARVVRRDAAAFLDALGLSQAELSVVLCGDARIRRLNRERRGKDRATDVLSFAAWVAEPSHRPTGLHPTPPVREGGSGPPSRGYRRDSPPQVLGDIMISFATARRQARERRHPLSVELSRLLAHGLLHLLGYDHERPADARRMAAAEDTLLGRAGMVRESRAGR